jgi:oligopeptide/dipeptide ABC transporter ATP-binding protein
MLELRGVRKTFGPRGRRARKAASAVAAVDGVDLTLERGTTTALVGESGSGKSTLARLILRLHDADEGAIVLDGVEIQDLDDGDMRPLRKRLQMVFQNPLTSFDPVHTIGSSILETMRLAPDPSEPPHERLARVLTEVGLAPRFAGLRPREMSGGELQRAGIARALSVRPDLMVMDEPTSALDMSIQGQVLELLAELQRTNDLTYLLVTHDLRAVRMVADRVVVMYLGQIVEEGPTERVFGDPQHPYTRGLLYAHDLAGRNEERDRDVRIRGSLRTPRPEDVGCRLLGRCPLGTERCEQPQALLEVGEAHTARCWRAAEGQLAGDAQPVATSEPDDLGAL